MAKESKLQSHKLICGENTVALGVENKAGHWNMKNFEDHVTSCPECSKLSLSVFSYIRKILKGEL